MKLNILDYKNLSADKNWAFCKGNLLDYLHSLKPEFFEFSVQRKIVNNIYLDNIYLSIENQEPIPPITLTASVNIENKTGDVNLSGKDFEILDGLQRTYRLWVIVKLYELRIESKCIDFKSYAKFLLQDAEGALIMQNSFVSPSFLKRLLQECPDGSLYIDTIIDAYSKYDIYFNIWTGLNDEEIVRKMLVLNAGQKSVTAIHQYELMFLHFFEKQSLSYGDDIKLIREKDSTFRDVQKGNRDPRHYLLSSVIVALQSFIHCKPLKVKPANQISFDDDTLMNDEIATRFFNPTSLSLFIQQLDTLGQGLYNQRAEYVGWYGRDTVLSGIFAAMGLYCIKNGGDSPVSSIGYFAALILKQDDPFKLDEYKKAYDTKAGNSNLGNVVRKAVFNYTCEYFAKGAADWYKHFDKSTNYDEE